MKMLGLVVSLLAWDLSSWPNNTPPVVKDLGPVTMHLASLPARASSRATSSVAPGRRPSKGHGNGTVFVAVASSPAMVVEWDLAHDREIRRVSIPVRGTFVQTAMIRTRRGLVVATANDDRGEVRTTVLDEGLHVTSSVVLGHGDAVATALYDDVVRVAWRENDAAHVAPLDEHGDAQSVTHVKNLPRVFQGGKPTAPQPRSIELAVADEGALLVVDAHDVVAFDGSMRETQRFAHDYDTRVQVEQGDIVLYIHGNRSRFARPGLFPLAHTYALGIGYTSRAVVDDRGETIFTCGGGVADARRKTEGGMYVIEPHYSMTDWGTCMGALWAFDQPLSIDGSDESGAERLLWFKRHATE